MANKEPFEKVNFRGRLMDRKTMAFLQAMERKLDYPLTVIQGSYNAGVVQPSAGTHDEGGVVDLASWDADRKVRVARELGAFAWHRADLPGQWGEHVHLGIRNHGKLAPSARDQQEAYDADPPRNGLADNAVDHSWHPAPPVEFKFKAEAEKDEKPGPEPNRVTRARDSLAQAIHSLGDAAALLDATDKEREVAQNQVDDLRKTRQKLRDVMEKLPKR